MFKLQRHHKQEMNKPKYYTLTSTTIPSNLSDELAEATSLTGETMEKLQVSSPQSPVKETLDGLLGTRWVG